MVTRIEGSDTYIFIYDTENYLVTGAMNGATLTEMRYPLARASS